MHASFKALNPGLCKIKKEKPKISPPKNNNWPASQRLEEIINMGNDSVFCISHSRNTFRKGIYQSIFLQNMCK